MTRVSVILPTYNESGHIVQLIDEIFLAFGGACEVLVLDDDSPDRTWELAQGLGSKYGDKLVVVRRQHDRGLRKSLAEGIERSRGAVVCWLDADFSMPPAMLPTLVAALDDGADVAVGSRYVAGGSDGRSDVPVHRLLSKIITTLASRALVPGFRDYTSGFIAIKREALVPLLPLEGDYGEYFIALIFKAFRAGRKIVELPYVCMPRRTGESKTATNLVGFATRGVGYLKLIARLKLGAFAL